MGRLSQLFWFLNAEQMPDAMEQRVVYTHLNITPELKKLRTKYRQRTKDENKQEKGK